MIVLLKERSLIKVSGEDAEIFLQSQFSNDVKNITEKQIQMNAYCQHQGKIISLLWVFKRHGNYYLSIPKELRELVITKLSMFRLMSKVVIEDFSEKVHQYGLINENNDKSINIRNDLSLLTSTDLITDCQPSSFWDLACINYMIPEVYLNSSEKFIPQALNLDIDQMGVSFTKGCYPGQEVVARMHYLGQPKRRLYRFISQFKVEVGDLLNVANSKSLKPSGSVIRVVEIENIFHFLGVFQVEHINDSIYLNNNPDYAVELSKDG